MATRTLDTVAVDETATNGHSSLLTFDDIVAADDIQTEYVDVPEWGGRVKVISLTGEERGKVFAAMRAHGKQIKDDDEASSIFYARVIAASLVDESGNRIAGQSKAMALTKKNTAALNRVYRVCARISGIGQQEEDQAKQDLKTSPSESSGTD